MSSRRSHLLAVFQALFVTFLWSTSWVLIKIGLEEIPALTFAGVRYTLSFLLLLPLVALDARHRRALRRLSAREWAGLALLGVVFYAVTQGSQFVGLERLPAVTVSLVLSFSPALVSLMGIPLLGEIPSRRQWVGVALFLAGVLVYFLPVVVPPDALGLTVVVLGLTANSWGTILGRSVNRGGRLHPLPVTTVSMGVGSILLLAAGLAAEGAPAFSLSGWVIVLWLALVNTAFAFTLWNHTLGRLTAIESSLINNTMLIQIAVLAWVFLGEPLTARQLAGVALAALGVVLVQLRGAGSDSLAPRRGKGMEFRHEPENRRFVAEGEGARGVLDYARVGEGKLAYQHTYVPPEHRGAGIASRLVRFALEHARAEGLAVVPSCPFVARYIDEHPEYADLRADR
ncbi:MAG: GNAT family N-acetyltransferase [Thermoanaerobaculia bacterium]|nr:GNAT family N-acetyltransferase [Thermoanaerobaculia bacterium]